MAKKQAGKLTKVLTTDDVSPLDPKEPLTTSWFGRIIITDVSKSEIAEKLNITRNGEYAIKVR
ncbi:MAG: transcription elongation factor subunit Spt4 [Candidatus Woesearchaeota archaeon]